MKRNYKTAMGLLAGVMFIFAGCDLNRYPYNSIAIENVDEGSFETLTLGNYATMKEEYFFKPIHQYGEYGGDNISLSGTTSDNLFFCYRYERVTDNYYPLYLWQFTYSILININNLIAEIEAVAEPGNETLEHLLGENYFMRAFLYFHCNNVFSQPYLDANGASNNLGLPIKTEPDPQGTYFPSRSTVAEVYEQIIDDATRAARLMTRTNNSPKSNIFASQETAWALLSRVYLYMGEYETAANYCDSVINSGRYRLIEGEEYRTYPTRVPESNAETIYSIRMTKDSDYEKYNMAWYSVGSMYATIADEGWGEMYASESYMEVLRKNPADHRFAFIDSQLDPNGGMWMIYVIGNEDNKTYDFATNTVERQPDGSWLITQGAAGFTSSTVQEEPAAEGGTQYFVVTTSGARYNVWIEEACSKRNEYPMRYVIKCSQQEGQAHLYSPVLLRLAEMYLTRAECLYHAGDYSGALADINRIRTRANIPERSLADATDPSTDVLTWVLEERRLELAWEGHRRYDIFRNRLTLDRRYPGSHLSGSAATVSLFIEPGDPRIAELIPQREIDAYPAGSILEQNP